MSCSTGKRLAAAGIGGRALADRAAMIPNLPCFVDQQLRGASQRLAIAP
jgi:hypothetical protein